jgi:hypothetical protein
MEPVVFAHVRQVILQVLNQHANFKPDIFTKSNIIVAEVIKVLGWDETKPEQYGFSPKRTNKKPLGMYRCIHEGFCTLKYRREPFCATTGYGLWGLTSKGIEYLTSLLPEDERPITKNYTAEFFNQLLSTPPQKGLTFLAEAKMTLAHRLRVSAESSKLEDHIQSYILKAIERDAFKEAILAGTPPTRSKVKFYMTNSSFTDIRSDGVEPVNRTLYGAKTATERVKGVKGHYSPYRSASKKDLDGDVWDWDIAEDETITDNLLFEDTWRRVKETIYGKCPNPKQTMEVLMLVADGLKKKEIAAKTNINPVMVGNLLATARQHLRENGVGL